jgi:hypothetical protein
LVGEVAEDTALFLEALQFTPVVAEHVILGGRSWGHCRLRSSAF